MKGKIGLEEHFASPDTLGDSSAFVDPKLWPDFKHKLLDINKTRLEQMDKNEIDVMILSLNAPAIQAIPDRKKAVDTARRANELLAEECAKNPKRFCGFAALAMQEPEEATTELIRCVRDYGFKGALVNGFSQVDIEDSCVYLDEDQYWPFWEEVEKLDVPFYLHPRCPIPSQARAYKGHEWLLGSVWGFSVETAIHALRLMGSGLFDAYPKLTIILGHLGEMLPANIWRTDHRMKEAPAHNGKFKKTFREYFETHFHITTSGNFRLPPLLAAIMEMGSDKIMFSTDYPFESAELAANWFDNVELGDAEKLKIGRLNAKKMFKLDFLD